MASAKDCVASCKGNQNLIDSQKTLKLSNCLLYSTSKRQKRAQIGRKKNVVATNPQNSCTLVYNKPNLEIFKLTTEYHEVNILTVLSNSPPFIRYTSLPHAVPVQYLHPLRLPYLPYVLWALRPDQHSLLFCTENTRYRFLSAILPHLFTNLNPL